MNLVELLTVFYAKELSNLFESLLPDALQFLKDILDSLDIFDLFVLTHLSLRESPVQRFILQLFGVEEGLDLLHMVRCLGPRKTL